MEDSEQLDRLTGQLRKLHAGIESYGTTKGGWWPTKAEEWVADVWRYDHALVAVAELLGLAVPPRPPEDAMRRLSPTERAKLERQLAARGIDLVHEPAEPANPPQAAPTTAAAPDIAVQGHT